MLLAIKNKFPEISVANPLRMSTFIVAEMSANHNQDLSIAIETIKAAKQSGADAIKIQTYTADNITLDCANEYFQIKHGTVWDGTTLYSLYKKAYTPWEWHKQLRDIAMKEGLIFFSSPFDLTAVDFLEKMDVPAYKVAAFEITDLPLIEYIASKGKPVIISTGIATISDIQDAIDACKRVGNTQIILLKCTSSYPAPIEESNLLTMKNMEQTFGVPVGLSDHSLGNEVALAAVTLGARIIEKHFILDKKIGGPDSAFSIDPAEFSSMVRSIRIIEKALGKVSYQLSEKTKASRNFCRSLFVVKDMVKGDMFTKDNIKSIRPGYGLSPKYIEKVIGNYARRNITKGTPVNWDLIE